MKVSTKGRYGLRAMIDLAVNSTGEQVPLNSIADRQNVSVNYLEQVFSTLRKAGLVKSVKGAQGGYILADMPSKIRVGDVLRVLEGELSIMDHVSTSGKESMEYTMDVYLREQVWRRVDEKINSVVDAITLEDLIHEYIRMNEDSSHMFFI